MDPNYHPDDDTEKTGKIENTENTMQVISMLMRVCGTIVIVGGLYNGSYNTAAAGAILIGLGFMLA